MNQKSEIEKATERVQNELDIFFDRDSQDPFATDVHTCVTAAKLSIKLQQKLAEVEKERDELAKLHVASVFSLKQDRDSILNDARDVESLLHRAFNALLMALNNQGGISGTERFPKPIHQEIKATRNMIELYFQSPLAKRIENEQKEK